jgi:uncharacterized membrane protein YhaH (DUF805 family)
MTELKPKQMSFAGAIKTVFSKYADFRGTASRPEYWYFFLFSVLLAMITGTIDSVIWPVDQNAGFMDSLTAATPIGTISQILLFLPTLAVQIRRLRDAGFSAHFQWLNLVPLILVIIAIPAAITSITELSAYPTEEEFAAIIMPFLPALLSIMIISLFYFVVTLLPTSAKFQKPAAEAAPINTGDAN